MSSRLVSLSLAYCALALCSLVSGQSISTPATNAPAASKIAVDPASKALSEAIIKMNANDVDGALAKLNEAIQLDPKIPGTYVLRASIYCQKKQWTQAEQDFRTASDMSPKNVVIRFNLVEVKFLQKQFDLARPGYVALEGDPDMGDLASYKVFLCDLFGGHEDLARKELDAFNKVGGNPSYYFSNAAWDLVHKNIDDARDWLVSASRIYSPRKNNYYASPLRDMGYLPIPEPKTAK